MWQMSGGHGRIDPEAAVEAMFAYHDAGFTTWDLADHYGPAEELVGEFRRRLRSQRGEAALAGLQFFTKWVPQPGVMTMDVVERAMRRSLQRMGVDTIDCLQFHWWDYEDRRYLDALAHMAELKRRGVIQHLALTNFDTASLRTIVDAGIPIISNQVQYSLIDRRPEVAMAAFCEAHEIKLLTYGTVAGGLLSARYLGQPEPASGALPTASLRKYKQMIDAWGGWAQFQRLLSVLEAVATGHGASIANVAVRYVLDRPAVGGVIIGARLGLAENISENAAVFDITLDQHDVAEIDTVLAGGNDLYQIIGDCGDEYRR